MDKKPETDLSAWLSTYGLVTAERILERFHIHLTHDELVASVNNPHSLPFLLLRVPLKNVFNGIILGQAKDYQTYAQKLFVDYLLSGEGSKEPDSPGATVREDLENDRITLIAMAEEFTAIEYSHQKLISESQTALTAVAKELPQALQTISQQQQFAIEGILANFIEQTEMMNTDLRNYRSLFYNLILRVTDLFKLLTDYRPDLNKQMENRSSLHFDAKIGEESSH